MWQLLAIWMITAATVIWFLRDERRVRAEAELTRAARYYAHAPRYRHVSALPEPTPPAPVRPPAGLSASQREFLTGFAVANRSKSRQARP
jgi:hypothetical protein